MASGVDQKTKQLYKFGPFRLDPEKELLLRDKEAVTLAPKAFQVLLVLIQRKQEIVTKDELLKAVWPDTFVEETNLSRNIFLLRRALGETPQDHQYIVTVPGRGYRFAEDVRLVPECEVEILAASHSKVEVEVKESKPWGWFAAAAAILVCLAVGTFKFFAHRSPVLNEKDTIVLADFANSTGEPAFDDTLRQGLAAQLEQSPRLQILDEERVKNDLRLMNVQTGAHITSQIAHDVCVREGGAVTVDGAIASLGRSYVITLQAVTCQEGATLAREQVPADDKEHVLNALGVAATAIRRKLSESLSQVKKLNEPLEQATTPSLEALKDYTDGLAVMAGGHFLASMPFYQRAVALDPQFTMAYFLMAVVYEQAGDMDRSAEYGRRAFSLIDRVSEPERIDITAYYYRGTGELDKEIEAYQLAVRKYPRRWGSHNQLSVIYNDMGRFEDGLREGLEASELGGPNLEAPFRRQMDAYMCLDRLGEANRTATKVQALGIDGSRIHQRFLELGYVEDDSAAIAREIHWFSGKPEEYLSFGLQAAELNLHGRRGEAHKEYERAADAAQRLGFRYVAEEYREADVRADALAGKCQTARSLGRPAFALAICGDDLAAEKLIAETSKATPNGTISNAVQIPEIRAMIALHHDQPASSIELLASASPYERAYPDAIYVRGLAYLRMHKGAEAVAEFRKIADHKGTSWGATWVHPNWGQYYALSYLGIARGFELAGNREGARKAFENFFVLWKDADPEIPVLQQAKVEYAKLK